MGKTKPGIDKIQKVADYFDVSVDYLLGREKMSILEKRKMKIFLSCTEQQKI